MKTQYQRKKQEIVIFDLDGTLIDSKPKMQSDVKSAFDRLGHNVDTKLLDGRQSWYDLANTLGITKDNFDKSFNKRKSWEQALRDGDAPLFQDTIPCLDYLSNNGVILGVLTRSTLDYTLLKLNYHGLTKYFEDRIAITPVTAKDKVNEALDLVSQSNKSGLEGIYFIGDKAEDVTIAKDVNEKYNIVTSGIYINRNGLLIPQEMEIYHKITSLEEVPTIVRGR